MAGYRTTIEYQKLQLKHRWRGETQVVSGVCNCLEQQKAGAMQGEKAFFDEGHATTFMGGVS
jgi:hypothetical protein